MKSHSVLITLLVVGLSHFSLAMPNGIALWPMDSCLVAGVYATAEDFAANHLTQKVDLDSSNNKFINPSLANDNTLTVVLNGKASSYKPNTIYGYLHCGQKFRYYKEHSTDKEGNYYKIEEAGKLVVYSLSQAHKGGTPHLHYYYSLSLSSSIKPLNEANLRNDFNDHTTFLKSIEILKEKNGKYNFSLKDNEGHFTVIVLFEHFSKK